MPARAPRSVRAAALLAVLVLAGCGSAGPADLPPAAGPPRAGPLTAPPTGRVVPLASVPSPPPGLRVDPRAAVRVDAGRVAVVRGRERVVELRDARTGRVLGRADAGVGPTRAVARDRWLWVVDTAGEALLVFRTRPKLQLVRRVFLPGGPYAIALDARKLRLWVTLGRTNEVAELPAHGRPHELRRLPALRGPDAVAVDSAVNRVWVAGRGELEVIDPPPLSAAGAKR